MKKLLLVLIISFISVFAFSQTTEEQLEAVTQELIDLTDAYMDLYEEFNNVTTQLEETTQALEESTDTIISIQAELVAAQSEIKILRGMVNDLSLMNLNAESIFDLGVGYTWPSGVEVLFEGEIPNFFLGFYGRVNLQFDGTPTFGVGITIDL